MKCPVCGSLNAKEWEKCVICGTPLHYSPNPSPEQWRVFYKRPEETRWHHWDFTRRDIAEAMMRRWREMGFETRLMYLRPKPPTRRRRRIMLFEEVWGEVELARQGAHHSNPEVAMRPPEMIPILTPIDAAQLAQLLMDEGYLRYQRSPTVVHDIYGKEYWGYYPRFRVAKTDLEDIEHFAKILGVTPRLYRGNWRIELAGDKLIEILKQIRPYIRGEKAPQVDIILQHGKFYIPNTTIPTPPTVLSLVEPERLKEYLKMKTPITPHIKGVSPTPQDIQTMRKLRQQGLTIREISEITGYSQPVVIKYLREALK